MDLAETVQCAAVFAVPFIVSYIVTGISVIWLRKRNVVQIPNQRSLHSEPTPSGGGIGIIAAVASGIALCASLNLPTPESAILTGALLIAMVGLADDLSGGIPILLRLCVQLLAAAMVAWATGGLHRLPFPEPLNLSLGSAAIPLTVLWIVGVTNIYNFLDGVDGYAGTQGVIAGIALACYWPLSAIGLAGLAIAGACAGFLPYNLRRARVFMGDVGSLTLGFLFASLPLQGPLNMRAGWVLLTALVLWFFLADGTFTFFRRLIRGERVWDAHRSHLYQRLVLANLRHIRVVAIMSTGASVVAISAVLALRSGSALLQWCAIGVACAAFVVFHQITLAAERAHAVATPGKDAAETPDDASREEYQHEAQASGS